MTSWLLSFGWNWLLVPVAIWFLRGVYVAWARPRLKYLSHTKTKCGIIVRLERQELLPPWRMRTEEWVLTEANNYPCTRLSDGYTVMDCMDHRGWGLWSHLRGLIRSVHARDAETEELSR